MRSGKEESFLQYMNMCVGTGGGGVGIYAIAIAGAGAAKVDQQKLAKKGENFTYLKLIVL